MKVLIDADTCAFAPAATTDESDPVWVATSRANAMVEGILEGTGATEFELWLSGPNNFRFNYYPEYKANRIGAARPYHERSVKDFLVNEWGAQWTDGCEADDIVACRQTDDTIIAHIDKDLDMIPGKHYNWELRRKGKTLREARQYSISEAQGLWNFYYQLLVGDPVDNLKGVKGVGPVKAKALLAGGTTPEEWLEIVRDAYSCDEDLNMQGACLWIWRELGDIWSIDTAISKSQRTTSTANCS